MTCRTNSTSIPIRSASEHKRAAIGASSVAKPGHACSRARSTMRRVSSGGISPLPWSDCAAAVEPQRIVAAEELAQTQDGHVERAARFGAFRIGPQRIEYRGHVDRAGAARDEQLQKLERLARRLRPELNRNAIRIDVQSTERMDAHRPRP